MLFFINPQEGKVEKDSYTNIVERSKNDNQYHRDEIDDDDDPAQTTQLVFILIDKSASMYLYEESEQKSRYDTAKDLCTKYTNACFKYHNYSEYGAIFFNEKPDENNIVNLSPFTSEFQKEIDKKCGKPGGKTNIFAALKKGAEILCFARDNIIVRKLTLRIIVISDGNDNESTKDEIADISNYLLKNKIRIDAVIISDEISKELVFIAKSSGGIAISSQSLSEGLDLFSKEEFFNDDLRKFGKIRSLENHPITAKEIANLKPITLEQLDREVPYKPIKYADDYIGVQDVKKAILCGTKLRNKGQTVNYLIDQLKIINNQPSDEFRIYPISDHINVWRVLIKGPDNSLYANKWFYMIIEFPNNFPRTNHPLLRFVHPPFHPSINDRGRFFIQGIKNTYKNKDFALNLIENIINLFRDQNNFNFCADQKREKLLDNIEEFEATVKKWNQENGRDNPEEWEQNWIIERAEPSEEIDVDPIPSTNMICPITNQIIKNPIKATSGVYYEKSAFETYLKTVPNPTDMVKTDEFGNPIPLPVEENLNLPVDEEKKIEVSEWIQNNKYQKDDEIDDSDNISYSDIQCNCIYLIYFAINEKKSNYPLSRLRFPLLNDFISPNKYVTSIPHLITKINVDLADELIEITPKMMRIIKELKTVLVKSYDFIRVFPLDNRHDVCRALIKGPDESLYAGKWFFITIEFIKDYPAKPPIFKFVYPPFHPNINDHGRIFWDSNNYKPHMTITETLGIIHQLLLQPNFEKCVDFKREQLKNNENDFKKLVTEWNDLNGRNSPDEWTQEWEIKSS